MTTRRLGTWALAALLAGCGSNSSMTGAPGSGDPGNGGMTGGTGGNGGNGGNGSDGGTGTGSGGNDSGQLPSGVQLGTYIVLGDSISDGGGTGPFFYESLRDDLTAKFPGLMYVHAAQAGAVTDAYSDGLGSVGGRTLASQVDGLGHSYPGDVLVTITIGGNDLNGHAIQAIGGTDAAARGEFQTHLMAELAALTAPGRLGSGKVYVVVSNVYDFTDGMGDFATVKCGPGANVKPDRDVAVFTAWNGVMSDQIKNVGATLYDMHADFFGHGYNNTSAPDVWYDSGSCIHPNSAGHDEIRRSIYKIVTGETLP
jgi:lysophospholipase L1-like esterase